MINATIGSNMLRVMPPSDGTPGFAQLGKVIEVTDDIITMEVQVDVIRIMKFRRHDSFDTAGLGSFLVRSPI